METPEQRVQRLVREEVAIAPYDPGWPEMFRREKEHLLTCLPPDLVRRIEHFGSTAVPGLAAKPIVDMLVEVTDLDATRLRIAPVLEAQGYEYLWRPTRGDDGPPFYAWFIKRNVHTGVRTHHIHMVEGGFVEHWDRLLFRDYLIQHPEIARDYERLKLELASKVDQDRAEYTRDKTEFICKVTEQAKRIGVRRWNQRISMGYDEELAERTRTVLKPHRGVSEKKMLGGLTFLVRGNMCCGVVGQDLMVRVGPDAYERALARPNAREMDFTGRPLKGMVYVDATGVRTAKQLQSWVDRGVLFARSLPAK